MKAVSQEKPCRSRFYAAFRYFTKQVPRKEDPAGPEYKFRLASSPTGGNH